MLEDGKENNMESMGPPGGHRKGSLEFFPSLQWCA